MLFSEVEGHMQKLSPFGRGKKFGLKSHLRGPSTQPFNCWFALSYHPKIMKMNWKIFNERSQESQML